MPYQLDVNDGNKFTITSSHNELMWYSVKSMKYTYRNFLISKLNGNADYNMLFFYFCDACSSSLAYPNIATSDF